MLNNQKLRFVLVLIGVLCIAPAAFADNHTMWLSSVSPGGSFLPGSVATGPYTANIDGVGGILVICNSFNAQPHMSGEAYKWTASCDEGLRRRDKSAQLQLRAGSVVGEVACR